MSEQALATPGRHGASHQTSGEDPIDIDYLLHEANLGDTYVAQQVGPRVLWRPYGLVVPSSAGLMNVLGVEDGETVPTWKPAEHAILSIRHSDTTPAAVQRGDLMTGQGATPLWARLARSVPGGANLLNILGLVNGDTEPAYKALYDATNPTTIAEGDAADPGTGTLAARITHKHAAPATWKATAHNLLDGDRHGDTVAQSVTRGSLVYGNSTPKWDELVAPASPAILGNDATDVAWDTMAWTAVAHNGANFTASSGSWTVASGDQITFRYRLIGKTMIIAWRLSSTDTSAITGTLNILIPASKTAAAAFDTMGWGADNGTPTPVRITVNSGGTTIFLVRADSAAWAASAGLTDVRGQIVIETT